MWLHTMPIPSTLFPISPQAGFTPPVVLYPSGGTANTLQATGFIPEIWSAKLVEKFYASTVLSAISNTDYEGEIQNQGDRVKIRTKPTITIRDYAADGLLGLDRPSGGSVELYIGIGKYFSLILDDVMEVQSDLNILSMWSDDAAQQLKIVVDKDVLSGIAGGAHAKNAGAAAGVISGNLNLGVKGTPLSVKGYPTLGTDISITDVFLRLGQALDEQNIPEQGRWIVMSAAAGRYIKQSELRQVYISGDPTSMLRNGRLGMVDRFTIYISNLLPNSTTNSAQFAAGEQPIYAGHAHALTFASQISKVETLRSEMTFGQILRGLQVYGYQIVDNTAFAQAQVTLT
jgi:hypothetical protein